MKCILIIAGSDPSGGAGIQADIKTAYKLGYYPMTVISALTAQNSFKISDMMSIPKEFVLKQMSIILEDRIPDAVKIGMLFSADIIREVKEMLLRYKLSPIILDPLCRASTGAPLLEKGAENMLKELFPIVDIITPNRSEAEFFAGIKISTQKDLEKAAKMLYSMGTKVLITGYKKRDKIIDLIYDGKDFFYVEDNIIDARNSHGSGCVFSTSLSIFIADGKPLIEAAQLAHIFTKEAIKKGCAIGKGPGSVMP